GATTYLREPLISGRHVSPAALEVQHVPNSGNFPSFKVFWKGKPLANAEVVALVPGTEKAREGKTDKYGEIKFSDQEWLQDWKPGLYGIRARHVEAKEGELDGKKYKEIRYYATLVMRINDDAKQGAVVPKEDPAASKLLQSARAARAQWKDFPG